MTSTPIQKKLDTDFAALFGPYQSPSTPEECHDETQNYGPLSDE